MALLEVQRLERSKLVATLQNRLTAFWWRIAGQQQPAVEQPDAFGPASDLFGGSGGGARGGWAGDSSGAGDAPQGLDTVHRCVRPCEHPCEILAE